MAADMAPAAVPGPAEPTGSATPAGPLTGMLASMLEPVDPARPTAAKAAPAAAESGDDISVGGGSSASFHEDREEAPASGTGRNSQQRQGVLRAWLLAGAARWHKGAGAHIKRLEVERAKHQARQVKETRQVTVNRSDGFSGKGSSRSGGADKSLTKKNSSDRPNKGPRNSSGTTRNVNTRQSSADGRSGSSSARSNPSPRKTAPEPKPSKTNPPKTNAQKTSAPKTTAPGSGSAGKAGAAGRDGKNGTNGTAAKDSNRNSTGGKQDKAGKGPGSKERPADSKTKPEKQPSSGGTSKTSEPKDRQGKDGAAGKAAKDGAGGPTGNGPVSLAKRDKAAGAKRDTEVKNKPGQATDKADQQDKPRKDTRSATDGKPFSTRESREAGYRDGTRAATAAAHVRAYRDGVKDGYGDTTEIANREKTRLDKAHADRKNQRQAPAQPPVPPKPSTPPTAAGPSAPTKPTKQPDAPRKPATSDTSQSKPKELPTMPQSAPASTQQPLTWEGRNLEPPIRVTRIDATHLELGAGATLRHISRGEVRTLKQFERRLGDKTWKMTELTEVTKALKTHADAQAKRATYLLEAAKGVKGGEKLISHLAKVQDAASFQAGEAEELHKRAVRATEACGVLTSNVANRYGDMYRAVVNSPETVPAELRFYKG